MADTAEEALDHNDGKEGADDALPYGGVGRYVQCQKKTGDGGTEVADGLLLLGKDVEERLKENCGAYANGDEKQCAKTEDHGAGNGGGRKRDENVAHDGGRGLAAMNVRRDRQMKHIIHYGTPPFPFLP